VAAKKGSLSEEIRQQQLEADVAQLREAYRAALKLVRPYRRRKANAKWYAGRSKL